MLCSTDGERKMSGVQNLPQGMPLYCAMLFSGRLKLMFEKELYCIGPKTMIKSSSVKQLEMNCNSSFSLLTIVRSLV